MKKQEISKENNNQENPDINSAELNKAKGYHSSKIIY